MIEAEECINALVCAQIDFGGDCQGFIVTQSNQNIGVAAFVLLVHRGVDAHNICGFVKQTVSAGQYNQALNEAIARIQEGMRGNPDCAFLAYVTVQQMPLPLYAASASATVRPLLLAADGEQERPYKRGCW